MIPRHDVRSLAQINDREQWGCKLETIRFKLNQDWILTKRKVRFKHQNLDVLDSIHGDLKQNMVLLTIHSWDLR